MSPFVLIATAAICAGGAGLLVYFVMQSQNQVKLAHQREELAAAKAALTAQKEALTDSVRYVEESARRKAMDDFLAEIRVEERHYTREHKMLFVTRRSLVRQERIFFRNIPLSTWVEQEMPIEEGVDADKLAQTMSIFSGEFLAGTAPEIPVRRLIR